MKISTHSDDHMTVSLGSGALFPPKLQPLLQLASSSQPLEGTPAREACSLPVGVAGWGSLRSKV